jgi:hypothetical protein
MTRRTLIYGVKRGQNPYGETTLRIVYFVCLRPRGRSIEMGVDGPVTYGPVGTTDGFSIAGTFAVAHASHGLADFIYCSKYQLGNCPSPTAWIAVVDVRTRRRATVPVPYWQPAYTGQPPYSNSYQDVPLAMSPNGALAWLQSNGPRNYQLFATLLKPEGRTGFSTSPRMIDSGNIGLGSVRFISDHTLTWTNGGTVHEMTLT